MINRWNNVDEREYASCHRNRQPTPENDLLRQAYATTLLGADNDLTMHGGGNTSVKTTVTGDTGNLRRALFVKATGTPLNMFTPDCFVAMDLDFLEGLKGTGGIDDETMAREFRRHQLIPSDKLPSIESLMHAFIPAKFVAHTHPAAILKIVNRVGGRELLKECFGGDLAYIPYTRMGFDLAKASSEAARENAGCLGVVIGHHGLVAWGGDARAVYDTTIGIATKAEEFLSKMFTRGIAPPEREVSADLSARNYELIAPVIRECLARVSRNIDGVGLTGDNISLAPLNTPDVLELINSPDGRNIISNPPMTPDYPMLRRILPVWVDVDIGGVTENIFAIVNDTISQFAADYKSYLESHGVTDTAPADLLPRAIIIPQVGVVCFGLDNAAAGMAADFTRQALAIRRAVVETGGVYKSLPERHLFDMQYRGYQKDKVKVK